MAWVKLDDNFPDHRKVLEAGPAGVCLWVCGLAYCNRQKRRDGIIPTAKVPALYPMLRPEKAAAQLVAVGLWELVEGGYRVHDYHDYQPTQEEAERIREARAKAGHIGGKASGKQRVSNPKAEVKQFASPERSKPFVLHEANANPVPVPVPAPENVDSKREGKSVGSAPPARRSRRVPTEFVKTPGRHAVGLEAGLADAAVDLEFAKFKDHEFDKPKSHWDGAWNNWVRNAVGRFAPRAANGTGNGRWTSPKTAGNLEAIRDAMEDIAHGAK